MNKKLTLYLISILILTISAFSLTGCSNIINPNKNKHPALSGMEVVFEDNFDELNTDIWITHVDNPIRRGGYWTDSQTFVQDGNLIIRTEYKEDGEQGAGWYTGTCRTRKADGSENTLDFTYGYFEVRCKAPAAEGLWSAFWLQSENMAKNLPPNNGINGAEIDIMESPYYNDPKMGKKFSNTTMHTIHVDGYMENHNAKSSKYVRVDKNMYTEFNTYGLMWTKDEYIFYINGNETWRTKFGVSTVPEFLWLSVEIAGESNSANPENNDNKFTWAGEITNNPKSQMPADFVVDYVKVYQKI